MARVSSNRPNRSGDLSASAATPAATPIAGAASGRRHGHLYYGWVLVGALATAQVSSWGILYYAFSAFLEPMQQELGWSRAALTGAYSLALLLSGAAAFPLGAWVDRHGARLVMTLGSVAAALLVFAWANVADQGTFYLIWAGIGLAMAAVLYEPVFVVVATWFSRRRGQALTLLTVVGGLASVIYVPLATWLIGMYGWRTALVTLAALLALLTLPIHALLVRRRPADLGLLPDGDPAPAPIPETPVTPVTPDTTVPDATPELGSHPASDSTPARAESSAAVGAALRGGAFWRLTLAFFLATLTSTAITVHLIPYLVGQGYSASFAALAISVIGLVAMPGRVIFTPLGDFLPRRMVTAVIFLTQVLGLIVLLLVPGVGGVLGFAALFGAGFGAITPARAALVAELYGPAHYGRINGALAAALMAARALSPFGVSLIYDQFGGYLPALWTLVALSLVATPLIATVGRPEGRDPRDVPSPSHT